MKVNTELLKAKNYSWKEDISGLTHLSLSNCWLLPDPQPQLCTLNVTAFTIGKFSNSISSISLSLFTSSSLSQDARWEIKRFPTNKNLVLDLTPSGLFLGSSSINTPIFTLSPQIYKHDQVFSILYKSFLNFAQLISFSVPSLY